MHKSGETLECKSGKKVNLKCCLNLNLKVRLKLDLKSRQKLNLKVDSKSTLKVEFCQVKNSHPKKLLTHSVALKILFLIIFYNCIFYEIANK